MPGEKRYSVADIQAVLDAASLAAYDEASKVAGLPALEGMTLQIQGVSPEGLDLDALPDDDLAELDTLTLRVWLRTVDGRLVGWESPIVIGTSEQQVVRTTRDAARSALADAIKLGVYR